MLSVIRRRLHCSKYKLLNRQNFVAKIVLCSENAAGLSTIFLREPRRMHSQTRIEKVSDIPTWRVYYEENKERLRKQNPREELLKGKIDELRNKGFKKDDSLNEKVSIHACDITKLQVDAIVNAANNSLLGGGGVDGAIHQAAGPNLSAECKFLLGCETGQAKITGGYRLPVKSVIHTVGPRGEQPNVLKSCYKNCLNLAVANNIRTIAFPCISTGIYGYPHVKAAVVAIHTVREFLTERSDEFDRIIFCLFLPKDVAYYEWLMQIYFPVE